MKKTLIVAFVLSLAVGQAAQACTSFSCIGGALNGLGGAISEGSGGAANTGGGNSAKGQTGGGNTGGGNSAKGQTRGGTKAVPKG